MEQKYKSSLSEIFGTYESLPLDKQDLLERYVQDVWNESQKTLLKEIKEEFKDVHMINMEKYIDQKLMELNK